MISGSAVYGNPFFGIAAKKKNVNFPSFIKIYQESKEKKPDTGMRNSCIDKKVMPLMRKMGYKLRLCISISWRGWHALKWIEV